MLRDIHVETTMFAGADDPRQTEKDLCWWLEALTQRNQDYLKQRPDTVRLYKSGVVWEAPKQFDGDCEEVMVLKRALGKEAARSRDVRKVLEKIQRVFGGEHFCDIGVILELGKIDCDGLACWRAAELRQAGIPAQAFMTSRKRLGGGTTYHALVRWPPLAEPWWTSEDPSLLLGMSQPQRQADREEEKRKNLERCDYLRTKRATPSPDLLEEVLGLKRTRRVG